ncbi:MAG TPA: DNA gyrase subunit A [Clostridiales bacterium]|jgi:DNA gyrase subunit A|nr:DNA gyrase subunit A [Clostridiales bacterium]
MSDIIESNITQDNHGGTIIPLDLETEVKRSFMAYSMAVIINRALPDVRDGLKPVHRRILYGMDELSLQPDKPTRKSARIVGDVMGKYHPHGDSSIYDAMVRLAQDFNMRYPLVQGQGNFGSIDGDAAAANRYTEARLDKLAVEMLRDIDKNTVDFMPNFDETLMEPKVLPSRFPNLLVNGSNGIAVGMATNIPPHNLGEVIDAYVALIDNPDITIEEIMTHIQAPDFPTGGIIMGTSGVRQAYRTGRGKVVVRGKAEIEDMAGNRQRIIVTEIPYQVNKATLVESISNLVQSKVIEGISDLRDESNREGIRIVIELKRDVNANVVLNQLYKHTRLQDTFGIIMLALVDNEPKVLNLKDMLRHYLAFQEEVVTRRTQYDLEKAQERLHILEGLLRALDMIDEIIEFIKSSRNAQEAKEGLIERFGFSEKQAQAILDMRLQRLTGLEREKLQDEHDELKKQVEYYIAVLNDRALLLGIIKDEILEVKRRFADKRRTEIEYVFDSADIDLDDIIQEEDMVVTATHMGYIKRISVDEYKLQRRGGVGVRGQTTKDDDFVARIFVTSTHNEIMFFTNTGRAFKMKCYLIPEAGRTAKGTPIVNLLQLQPGESITAAFPVTSNEGYLMLATRQGIIKKTPMSEFDNIRKGGIIAQKLYEGDSVVNVLLSSGNDEIIIGTKFGKAIRFNESDVRPMGRTAAGVRSVKLAEGDEIIDMQLVQPDHYVLCVTENGMGKRTIESQYRMQKRGGKGIMAMQITEKTGYLSCMRVVQGDEELMLISTDGTVIRVEIEHISAISRATQGVRIMRLNEGAKVASVAVVESNTNEDAELEEPEVLDPADLEAASAEADEDIAEDTDESEE